MLTQSYSSERYGDIDITSSPRSPSPTSFASAYAADPDRHDPGRFFKVPILGIRIGPDGERLVYRVAWPPTYGVGTRAFIRSIYDTKCVLFWQTPQPTEVEGSERVDDPDQTLTDITSNAKMNGSESK
jgi:hypothetical protein